MKNNKNSTHLPLYGVGPVIIFGQFIFTASAIILTFVFDWSFAKIDILKIPFLVAGIILIGFGIFLDLSAKLKSKLFKNVAENKLITDGVYSITRNPVYSGAFLGCAGAVLIANNLLLLFVPIVCWIYMTVFLINTEEKWLKGMYGAEYDEYCKRVNRCIPGLPKRQI